MGIGHQLAAGLRHARASSVLALSVLLAVLAITPGQNAAGETLANDTIAGTAAAELWVLGDSLCVLAVGGGQLPAALAAGFDQRWEHTCKIGANLTWGVQQVELRSSVPPLVVVELGTNRMPNLELFTTYQQRLAQQLFDRGAQQVVWLTAHTQGTSLYFSQNDITRANSAPEGYLVSDWATIAEQRSWYYGSDTVHHTFAGRVAFSSHIADAAALGQQAMQRTRPSAPVLDQALLNNDGTARLTGWYYGNPADLVIAVDALGIGTLSGIATRPMVTHARPDVDSALGRLTPVTGFTVTLQIPARRSRVCLLGPSGLAYRDSCLRLPPSS